MTPPINPSGKPAKKPATASQYRLEVPAYPDMTNELGHVKASHMLKLIDIAGSVPPVQHLGAGAMVVTASLDRTRFVAPVRRWDLIRLDSRLTRVWGTSCEVRVLISAWDFRSQQRRHIATAYLVFVGMDSERKKTPFPALVPMCLEDLRLAREADLRKQSRLEEAKTLPMIPIDLAQGDEPVVVSQTMTANEANAQNNVFGGVILSLIGDAAAQVATRHVIEGPVTGVWLNRMSFIAPAFIGETVTARAVMTQTWNTSMGVQVEVDATHPHTGECRRVATSFLVYVRMGLIDAKPVQVPPWIAKTELQRLRAEDSNARRKRREAEQLEAQKLLETTAPLSCSVYDRLCVLWNRWRYASQKYPS